MNDYKDLMNRLTELIPEIESAKMIAEFSELPVSKINFSGPPRTMWFRILTEAKKYKDGIERIVDSALGDYPEDEVLLATKKKFAPAQTSNNGNNAKINIDTTGLKTLLAMDKVNEVLIKLAEVGKDLGSQFQNDIILFKARYTKNENDNVKGIISSSDYAIEKNRLRNAILSQIDTLSS